MKFFSSLKNQATNFLEKYKNEQPAMYAAAEQAIGAILITDGLFGINSPFGDKKRPGIFGTIGGMIFGIIFILIPAFSEYMFGMNKMTATTPATIVSVDTNSSSAESSNVCSLVVQYAIAGKEYTNKSAMSSSSYCSLSKGHIITVNYNPSNPGSWVYDDKTFSKFLQIFFWAGLLVLISSMITFLIRLISIIFGWKLLKNGRKMAANLPADSNFQAMIDEIKQRFTKSIFGSEN
jgi:hypothetical protein